MILEPLILPLLIFALTIPEQVHQTEDERNTIAAFSKAKLGVVLVHIKARQQESTEFGAHQHSESTGSGFLIDYQSPICSVVPSERDSSSNESSPKALRNVPGSEPEAAWFL